MSVPALLGQGTYALAVGALAGALLACAPARAQTKEDIGSRIESTFDLVLGNRADLAVPLTRRALARRSQVLNGDTVEPLAYQSTGAQGDANLAPTAEADAAPATQPSTGEDPQLARLPRPRPIVTSEAPGAKKIKGRPLDLVAAAAAPLRAEPAPLPKPPPREAAQVGEIATLAVPTSETPSSVLIPPASTGSAQPKLVASGSCLTLGDVSDKDGDFKRNDKVLSGADFCIEQKTFKERHREWVIQTVKSRRPGPLWAVMHDDENLSFDNAVKALRSYGGTLVAVETGGKRNLTGVDPNRNFSGDGIGCSKLGNNAAPIYTKFFHDLMLPSQPVIALHNNDKGPIPTGGLGHVSMDHVPKDMRASPAPHPDGPLAGNHSLVLLASFNRDDKTALDRMAVLNREGINAVLEHVNKGHGDCSLSNFAVEIGNPAYFNVTVDHGEADKQMRIIDVLMSGREEAVASQ